MKSSKTQGRITFINHEKKYAIIEYEQNGKKKTATGNIDISIQKKAKENQQIKKTHHFLMGDVVNFTLKLSDRGDRFIATGIEYLYNTALDVLVNKSRVNNRFLGYLKEVDNEIFVKEIDSYLFFPVPMSPWQLRPAEAELNEQVAFSLENTEKKDRIYASLFNNNYIPEFSTAVKYFKNKTPIEAEVYKVSAHGIYVNLIGDKIQAKLPIDKNQSLFHEIKTGDKINVVITHLSKSRITIEKTDGPVVTNNKGGS